MAHNHGVLSFFLFASAICRHSSEQCALKQTTGTKADSKPDQPTMLPFMNITFIWSNIKRFRDYTRDGNVTFRMPCTKSHTAHRICKEHSHDYKAGEHTSSLMLKSMEHAAETEGGGVGGYGDSAQRRGPSLSGCTWGSMGPSAASSSCASSLLNVLVSGVIALHEPRRCRRRGDSRKHPPACVLSLLSPRVDARSSSRSSLSESTLASSLAVPHV